MGKEFLEIINGESESPLNERNQWRNLKETGNAGGEASMIVDL
jgi:hypothetical protein